MGLYIPGLPGPESQIAYHNYPTGRGTGRTLHGPGPDPNREYRPV